MPTDAKDILILSSWYPSREHPFLGNFVERQATLLSSAHKVTVLNLESRSDEKEIRIEESIQDNFRLITVSFPKKRGLSSKLKRFRAFKEGLKRIGQVDLIIGHVLLPHGWMFIEAAKRKKSKLIWVEHGSYFRKDVPKKWHSFEKWMLHRVQHRASEIVAVSEFLKSDMQAHLPGKKIRVIGNHVDESCFTFKPKNRDSITKFLHVSTLDESTKNPKGILDACALLAGETKSFEMTILSDEDYSKWEQYSVDLGISGFVKFAGPLDWKEIPPFYHQSDAFVLFSNYETFSIVLAEALCTGTPIVSTKVGIAGTLPDQTIGLVERGNTASLKQMMKSVVDHSVLFDYTMIEEAGKQYHSEAILNQWNQLIEEHAL